MNITVIKTTKELPMGWYSGAWCANLEAAQKVTGGLFGYYCMGNKTLYYCKATA